MARRGNGEGTIYRRKDGRWETSYFDAQGKRNSIYGRTREVVGDRLTDVLKARKDGLPRISGRAAFGTFLGEWLAADGATVRIRTHDRREELVRLHVLPTLGRRPLAQLAPADLQKLYAAKLASGLAPRTVHHIHATIHRALAQAERWGRVARNVASLVDAPRVPEHEMATLDEEQLRALLASARDSTQEAVIVLAATTGMRLSELLGLRWCDVDLEHGEVKLRATLERHADGPNFVETKTKGSRRRIVLVEETIDALCRHRLRQTKSRIAAGPAWVDWDLVFADARGEPISEWIVRKTFRAALKHAGCPRIRFHDLRHTAATTLLGRNVNVKIVSEMLGHSRSAITMDLYSHVTPTMQREAASAMQAALGGTR